MLNFFAKKSRKSRKGVWGLFYKHFHFFTILTSLLAVFVLASMVFVVQTSQEIRNRAMTGTGVVEVKPVLTPTNLVAGQPAELAFQVNTHGSAVIGVQLVVNLTTTAKLDLTSDKLKVSTENGFTPILTSVNPTVDGYQIQIVVRPTGDQLSTLTYSNNAFTTFAQMNFTPQTAGSFTLSFVPKLTTAVSLNSVDLLKTIPNFSAVITSITGVTATPILSRTPTPSRTPTKSPTPIKSPTPTSSKPGQRKGQNK